MQELTAISGVGEKGPACFLYTNGDRRLLLDLGQGPDEERLPDIEAIGRVDAILFSHGHVDHTGGLSLWTRLGKPPLFATRPTIALARHPALQTARPLESVSDLFGLSVETGACGHAPGAVWIRLNGVGGLVYTGDCSLESSLFRATLPPRARALVFDASYGLADTALADQITAIDAAINGPVLFPAPAGGRGLEMACHFLERGHAVSICPTHRAVARVLLDHGSWLEAVGLARLERLLAKAGSLEPDSHASGIMIATGPNAEHGVAEQLARRMVRDGSGQVIFTGHIAAGLPSQAMLHAGQASFLRWNVHPRFSEQRQLIEAVRPEQALAAFTTQASVERLAQVTNWPIASGHRITW